MDWRVFLQISWEEKFVQNYRLLDVQSHVKNNFNRISELPENYSYEFFGNSLIDQSTSPNLLAPNKLLVRILNIKLYTKVYIGPQKEHH